MTPQELFQEAIKMIENRSYQDRKKVNIGKTVCVLLTKEGHLYTGVSLELSGSVGFYAETAALAEMIKHDEVHVNMIVTVQRDGKIVPPCKRCCELLYRLDRSNRETQVIVAQDQVRLLSELISVPWIAQF